MPFLAKYNARMFWTYHVYAEDFAEMYYHQEERCAICLELPTTSGFVIDHDHKTGNIRGLLCHRCNTVLGRLEIGLPLGKYEFMRQRIEHYQENYYGAMRRVIVEFKNGMEVDRRSNERVLSKEETLSLLGRVNTVRYRYCQGCYQLVSVAELNEKQLCHDCQQTQHNRQTFLSIICST